MTRKHSNWIGNRFYWVDFSNDVYAWICDNQVSQTWLSRKAGVPKSCLSNLMHYGRLDLDHVISICAVTGLKFHHYVRPH